MAVLPRVRNLEDLVVTASLPSSAIDRLQRPLNLSDVRVTTTKKRRGGYRVVCQPREQSLTRLQKRLKEFIDRQVLVAHPCVHGFTRGRGTRTNALAHLNARAMLTVDISDFFPTIRREQVEDALQIHGANPAIAAGIANVSTFGGSLATGFSTSPVLSNLVFRPVDEVFEAFAAESGLVYTRYADDLTFSGERASDEDLAFIGSCLSSQGYRLNSRKVRFQRRGHAQVVTGFVVAHPDAVRLPKVSKKALRQDLYFAGQIGVAAQARHRSLDEDAFVDRLLGRISYLMGVEPELALRMRREFESILTRQGLSGTVVRQSDSVVARDLCQRRAE